MINNYFQNIVYKEFPFLSEIRPMNETDTRVLYEFTATLRPIWYKKSPEQQYDLVRKVFDKHLMPFDITAVVELTSVYNIHIHCALRLSPQEYRKFTDVLRIPNVNALFGRSQLKQVQYDKSYYDYMKKDIVKTMKVIDRMPILADKLQVLIYKPIEDYDHPSN